jgi:pimeloyl-ACP methyl ester carboxylesterase
MRDSPLGGVALGAANGIFGDRLVSDHPDLSLELTVRRAGSEVAMDPGGIASTYPDAAPRIAVFVHGLCETEQAWMLTPLGGEPCAERLDELVAGWPTEVDTIALIGHSMGGLVVRSACHYGASQDRKWVDHIGDVICLGTPHLGAPLEKAANVAGWAFNRLPETRPFGHLFINGRSAGIKDLRFGSCLDEDWCDCDPDEFLRDRCSEVPFLESATYSFVGATLSSSPEGVGAAVGDLLVTYRSASGAGRKRRIPFRAENGRHIGRVDHLRLLNHPVVYAQIRDWLARSTESKKTVERGSTRRTGDRRTGARVQPSG